MPDATRTAGPLRPVELATASVLATLAVVLTVAGWFLPHLSVIAAFAVVPLGVVAHHHRLRALLVSAFAAAILTFLVAGTGAVTNIVECAAVGGLVGVSKRRGWGGAAVIAGVAVIGPILAGLSVGLLFVFGSLRKLTITQIRDTWKGVRRILLVLPPLQGPVHRLDLFVNDALRYWWASVAVVVVVATIWFAALGWVFLGAVLERLQWIRAQDRLDVAADSGDPAPVPAEVEEVWYRYPGTTVDALRKVSLSVRPAEMLALVGDNGSGKSTLVRILAGHEPSAGRVVRAGAAGLGRLGGTAMIMQQPDTQVLGVRVADDVVWGLADDTDVDVEAVLASVGLEGMAERETSGLSGGELQRLAVAAALTRRPALLLSDESTAMVDEAGRQDLTALLRRLPADTGMAVVHVTHRPEEAEQADHRYRMASGVLREDAGPIPAPVDRTGPGLPHVRAGRGAAEALEVQGLTHLYSLGTPWEHRALDGIDLTVDAGEGVLVVGGNGSGKSTLAWIMAGLMRPTFGRCTLGGRPIAEQVGSVALAFQHSRLQLHRSTVGRDLRAAGATDESAVRAVLGAVGLDRPGFADRRIDELSGGQQRRVALAGLLSRHPSVLILDEPMAGLDLPSREGLLDLLGALRRDQGLTLIVISHDLTGTERVCDRLVRLDAGRIVSDSASLAAGL